MIRTKEMTKLSQRDNLNCLLVSTVSTTCCDNYCSHTLSR